eukprot:3738958-Rhodomonas_salina.1
MEAPFTAIGVGPYESLCTLLLWIDQSKPPTKNSLTKHIKAHTNPLQFLRVERRSVYDNLTSLLCSAKMKLECHGSTVFCVVVPVGTFVAFLLAFSGLWVCWRRYGRKHRAIYESKVSDLIDLPLVFCSDPELLPPSKAWDVEYSADLTLSTTGQANMIFNRDGTVLGSGTHQNREYVLYGKFDSNQSIVSWVEVERGALRQENTYDMQGLLLDNETFFTNAGRRDPLIRMCVGKLLRITDRSLVCRNSIEGYFWSSHGGSGTIALKTDNSTAEAPKGDIVLNLTDIPYVSTKEKSSDLPTSNEPPTSLPSSPLKMVTDHPGPLLLQPPSFPLPVAKERIVQGQLVMHEEEDLEAAGTGLLVEEGNVNKEESDEDNDNQNDSLARSQAPLLGEDERESSGSESGETFYVNMNWESFGAGVEDERASERRKDSNPEHLKPGPASASLDTPDTPLVPSTPDCMPSAEKFNRSPSAPKDETPVPDYRARRNSFIGGASGDGGGDAMT